MCEDARETKATKEELGRTVQNLLRQYSLEEIAKNTGHSVQQLTEWLEAVIE